MTTIKATCPTCGEVSLTPGDITLRVDEVDDSSSFYGFTCPRCTCDVRKPADRRIVRLLQSGGVPALPIASARPSPAVPKAPALTHDDLLDFHELLAGDDWFARLQALV